MAVQGFNGQPPQAVGCAFKAPSIGVIGLGMTDRHTKDQKAERQARLAAALRANLRRRKEESRPKDAENPAQDAEQESGSQRRS
jgi:hypothetical protein